MAADLTCELRLQVREANVITPALGADDDRVRALVVTAIDDEPGRARLPHFPESDLLLPWHRCNFAKNRYQPE
jgi:hypothetical protein